MDHQSKDHQPKDQQPKDQQPKDQQSKDHQPNSEKGDPTVESNPFRLITICVVAITLAATFSSAFVIASEVFFLVFLGVLFAVFLVKTSRMIEHVSSFSYSISLGATLMLLVFFTFASLVFFGNRLIHRIDEFESSVDQYSEIVKKKIAKHEQVHQLAIELPLVGTFFDSVDEEPESPQEPQSNESKESTNEDAKKKPSAKTLRRGASLLTQLFATTLGLLTNLAVIFFVGVFIAVDPHLYKSGVVQLFPIHRRDRIGEVMDELGSTLWQWLIGRSIAILIISVGTSIALWALGVPLPITLGIITGLLTFVPNVGGLFAFVFAVIFALSVGVSTAIWVAAIYLALQFVESNIITPLVQQKQVSVPPAMMIASQFLMGVLFGILGILVATPLLAISMVATRKFYIEDCLESEDR